MTLVYDEGVFKPQGPVPSIKNHAVIHVVIVEEGEPTQAVASAESDDEASGWNNLMEMAGCIEDSATDVARNHDKYLYGKA